MGIFQACHEALSFQKRLEVPSIKPLHVLLLPLKITDFQMFSGFHFSQDQGEFLSGEHLAVFIPLLSPFRGPPLKLHFAPTSPSFFLNHLFYLSFSTTLLPLSSILLLFTPPFSLSHVSPPFYSPSPLPPFIPCPSTLFHVTCPSSPAFYSHRPFFLIFITPVLSSSHPLFYPTSPLPFIP